MKATGFHVGENIHEEIEKCEYKSGTKKLVIKDTLCG